MYRICGKSTACILSKTSHWPREFCQSNVIPLRAQVVICGGGVVGSSVAYHLPKYGFKDVIHVEQGR